LDLIFGNTSVIALSIYINWGGRLHRQRKLRSDVLQWGCDCKRKEQNQML